MMLALQTNDTWTWALDVTVAGNLRTYTNSATDAVSAVAALLVWLNAAGRPWYGTRTFSCVWQRSSATGASLPVLSATGGTFAISAAALATLGWAAAAGVSHVLSTGAAGTWSPLSGVSVLRDVRLLSAGDACANGAVRPGVPGLACRLPKIDAVGTAADAARLAAVLASASNPRRAQVWQVHTQSWVEVALGAVSRNAQGATLYRFTLDAAGDAV